MDKKVRAIIDGASAEFVRAWEAGGEAVLRLVARALRNAGGDTAAVAEAIASEDFRALFAELGYTADLDKMRAAYAEVLRPMVGRGGLSEATVQGLASTFSDSFLAQAGAYPDRLKEATLRALLGGGGVDDIRRALADELGPPVAETLANTSLNTYSRSVERAMAEQDPPDQLYVYEGPRDDRTRDECLAMLDAGPLTLAEIDSQFPGAFVDGGGYNCRHSWVPVEAAAEGRPGEAE
jgi:hypothetical protein